MKTNLPIVILMLLCGNYIRAQSSQPTLITAVGNSISNSNYLLDYSLGEPAIITLSGAGVYNTQGFNQPSYNPFVSISENEKDVFSIYPNPTTSYLKIETTRIIDDLEWVIYNASGERIKEGEQQLIETFSLPNGLYLIRLRSKEDILSQVIFIKQ